LLTYFDNRLNQILRARAHPKVAMI